MSSQAAIVASFALCYAGLSGICLAIDRHHQQVLKRRPSIEWARGLRVAGWLLLALSAACSLKGWGASVGAVAWFGVLSAAALLIVLLLSYVPAAVVRGAPAATVTGLALIALAL